MTNSYESTFEFRCKAFGYDPYNAYALGVIAQLAYRRDMHNVVDIVRDWGFEYIRFFERDETQALLIADQEKIIVGFRGSEPILEDWVTDFKIRKTAGPGGNVHRGFYSALYRIWAEVEDAIEDARDRAIAQAKAENRVAYSPPTLWFTGHSLGGALATMATALSKFNENPLVVNGLYTYGQPRVGSEKFAANFNNAFKSQAFRLVNNNDIVTRVPPSAFDYSHIGQLRYFDKDGIYKVDADLNWWNTFWDRVGGHLEGFIHCKPDSIDDHSLAGHYLPHLKQHRDQWILEQQKNRLSNS
jgi:triacylglycerol lipase